MATPDSTVTARVPKEIREQADAALKRIDSTVTELVNAAFTFVIKTGALPTVAPHVHNSSECRTARQLTPEQQVRFDAFVKATSLPLSAQHASLSAKQIKALRLAERHEA
jgi:antitoxin component of RelBE/YafQ-DinJ toxin-antitoxin module